MESLGGIFFPRACPTASLDGVAKRVLQLKGEGWGLLRFREAEVGVNAESNKSRLCKLATRRWRPPMFYFPSMLAADTDALATDSSIFA